MGLHGSVVDLTPQQWWVLQTLISPNFVCFFLFDQSKKEKRKKKDITERGEEGKKKRKEKKQIWLIKGLLHHHNMYS